MRTASSNAERHVSDGDLVRLLNGAINGVAREPIAAHVSNCPNCEGIEVPFVPPAARTVPSPSTVAVTFAPEADEVLFWLAATPASGRLEPLVGGNGTTTAEVTVDTQVKRWSLCLTAPVCETVRRRSLITG